MIIIDFFQRIVTSWPLYRLKSLSRSYTRVSLQLSFNSIFINIDYQSLYYLVIK